VLLGSQLLDATLRLVGILGPRWKEDESRRVAPGTRQVEIHRLGEELVWHLGQDPGPVTGGDLGSGRPSVGEVLEGSQALVHERVTAAPVQVRDERDAARIVFERGVVKALLQMLL